MTPVVHQSIVNIAAYWVLDKEIIFAGSEKEAQHKQNKGWSPVTGKAEYL